MEERVLVMMEVSQKQSYIFATNALMDHVKRSAAVSWVTSAKFIKKICQDEFSEEEHLVYGGGGHIVLTFSKEEEAKKQVGKITRSIREDFPEMEVFVKLMAYDKEKGPAENLEELERQMEQKKAVRKAAFCQGTFGIEKMDAATLTPIRAGKKGEDLLSEEDNELEKLCPQGYIWAKRFEDLGISKGESSFIAVVHIDGNGMGKRVKEFRRQREGETWETYRKRLKKFSQDIDRHYKEAFGEMESVVKTNLESGRLSKLSLEGSYFPVRGIIAAGDDICFVTEGRIGLESAAAFLRALVKKKNEGDQRFYEACAGVAIVHHKYPFYRAYELAKQLCESSAKNYAAKLGGACVMDWHFEFGEIADSVEELRKDYVARDGSHMMLRPYFVCESQEGKGSKEKAGVRTYENFRSLMRELLKPEEAYASGKLSQLRGAIREGEKQTAYFLKKNLLDKLTLTGYQNIYEKPQIGKIGTGEGQERRAYVQIQGEKYSLLYDGVEARDLYLELEEGGK